MGIKLSKEKYDNDVVLLNGQYPFNVKLIHNTEENRELFVIIYMKIEELFDALRYVYIENNHPTQFKKEIENLLTTFQFDQISENVSSFWNDDTSYVLEKKELHICTTYTENGQKKLHDPDVILYVLIHELAHVGLDDFGHTERFWMFMRFLIDFAKFQNILKDINFVDNPIKYCDKILINQNF